MNAENIMKVKEIFTLSDGKSIFLGILTENLPLIRPGKWKLLVDNAEHSILDITGEQIMTRRAVVSEYRALSTYARIEKEEINPSLHSIELVQLS